MSPLKSHKMPNVSPRKPDTNKGFSKHFTAVCHSSHGYKLHKTRQTASLKRSEALCAMSCPACLCPELQILTTGGTRTRDAYSLLANTTMLITCVPTKSLLDGHGHDHAIHCSVLSWRHHADFCLQQYCTHRRTMWNLSYIFHICTKSFIYAPVSMHWTEMHGSMLDGRCMQCSLNWEVGSTWRTAWPNRLK